LKLFDLEAQEQDVLKAVDAFAVSANGSNCSRRPAARGC
jgi:hypothetical protein